MHKEWDKNNIPFPISKHMCRYTCLFLKDIIEKEHSLSCSIQIGCPEESKNGTPHGLYGFQDRLGNWHDHSWVLIGDQIVDITADQFGELPVITSDVLDKRYRPSPDQAPFANIFNRLSSKSGMWVAYYAETCVSEVLEHRIFSQQIDTVKKHHKIEDFIKKFLISSVQNTLPRINTKG